MSPQRATRVIAIRRLRFFVWMFVLGRQPRKPQTKARCRSAPRKEIDSLYGKVTKSLARWLAMGVPIPVTKS
jgi:hypothetical protein